MTKTCETRERSYNNILLHIPHASIGGLGAAKWDDHEALQKEVKKWTDWYIDLIFYPVNRNSIKTIFADYSRFVVDVERFPNDSMDKIGQGVIYTKYNGLRRTVDEEEQMGLMAYYYSYMKQLKSMINERSLLIDCRSFPSGLSDIDVCIGVNEGWSRPTDFIIELLVEFFKTANFKVEVNSPYSNPIAPSAKFKYNSVMIALNKRLYLNEQTIELLDSAKELRRSLNDLYNVLLRYSERI